MKFLEYFPPLLWVILKVNFMGKVGMKGAMEKEGEGEKYACLWIHPLVKVFSTGEEVSNHICVSGNMFQGEVKVLEEFHPSGLVTGDFLGLVEVLEWSVLMMIE
jgi:hypothetical protein